MKTDQDFSTAPQRKAPTIDEAAGLRSLQDLGEPYPEDRQVAEMTIVFVRVDLPEEVGEQHVDEHRGITAEDSSSSDSLGRRGTDLKLAASGGKDGGDSIQHECLKWPPRRNGLLEWWRGLGAYPCHRVGNNTDPFSALSLCEGGKVSIGAGVNLSR